MYLMSMWCTYVIYIYRLKYHAMNTYGDPFCTSPHVYILHFFIIQSNCIWGPQASRFWIKGPSDSPLFPSALADLPRGPRVAAIACSCLCASRHFFLAFVLTVGLAVAALGLGAAGALHVWVLLLAPPSGDLLPGQLRQLRGGV